VTLSINPATYVITVPQADLLPVSGSLYELDVDAFRLALKDWEDSELGMAMPDTHSHATQRTLSGETYARQVEILAPYTVTFEEVGPPYRVKCVGANHNISDVQNLNNVSLIIGNSAGLIAVATGAGPSAPDIAAAVWDEPVAAHVAAGSFGELEGGNMQLTIEQVTMLREMYKLLGLDPAFQAKHGKTYIRVPADGSLIDIQMTEAGSGASKTVTKQRL
jgi:hypothetical protein